MSLNGVASLNQATAEQLAEFKGKSIWLEGVTSLDTKTADILSKYT